MTLPPGPRRVKEGHDEGENPDLENSDSDDDDDENTDESEKQGLGTSTALLLVAGQVAPTESRITFEIDPDIDIYSKALLDMISQTDILSATET